MSAIEIVHPAELVCAPITYVTGETASPKVQLIHTDTDYYKIIINL